MQEEDSDGKGEEKEKRKLSNFDQSLPFLAEFQKSQSKILNLQRRATKLGCEELSEANIEILKYSYLHPFLQIPKDFYSLKGVLMRKMSRGMSLKKSLKKR